MRKKIVVLISGEGTTLQAIIDACKVGKCDAEISAVISNKKLAGGLVRAFDANIPTKIFDRHDFPIAKDLDQAMGDYISSLEADLIVLAGYMRILNHDFIQRFAGRIVNIHPSLLPKYPGLNTYARAMVAKESEHGTTVHFVNSEVDSGAVILQAKVPIFAKDSIEDIENRVKAQEAQIYPLVIQWFVSGRLQQKGNQAYLDGNCLPPQGYAMD